MGKVIYIMRFIDCNGREIFSEEGEDFLSSLADILVHTRKYWASMSVRVVLDIALPKD